MRREVPIPPRAQMAVGAEPNMELLEIPAFLRRQAD
jgi:hypothetical protein